MKASSSRTGDKRPMRNLKPPERFWLLVKMALKKRNLINSHNGRRKIACNLTNFTYDPLISCGRKECHLLGLKNVF
ncbi:hypothetical protein CK820_G0029155 [Pan troglodytes]|uniref:Uncharacterized protein n=1 Tax=Pan troglodytes TaxID=9598 RepID=A0A2J8LF95_PANTR|nr:hypothetical protein CK820_G0029155 [Pan troglodytes]